MFKAVIFNSKNMVLNSEYSKRVFICFYCDQFVLFRQFEYCISWKKMDIELLFGLGFLASSYLSKW